MPELLILCKGMAKALHTVGFVILLLVVLLYIFSIAFVQLLKGSDIGDQLFANIFGAMNTLLVTGAFLDNITQVITDLGLESVPVMLLFFIFVSLSALMVMNMLIGVLCEVVSAVAETEKEEMLLSFVKEKMKTVLERIDEDNNGTVSRDEFTKILSEQDAVLALEELGVDPVSLVDFTDQIFAEALNTDDDDDSSGELTFPMFMEVIIRYRGSNQATQKDLIDHRKWITSYLQSSLRKQAKVVKRLVAMRLNGESMTHVSSVMSRFNADSNFLSPQASFQTCGYEKELQLVRKIHQLPPQKRQRVLQHIELVLQEKSDSG